MNEFHDIQWYKESILHLAINKGSLKAYEFFEENVISKINQNFMFGLKLPELGYDSLVQYMDYYTDYGIYDKEVKEMICLYTELNEYFERCLIKVSENDNGLPVNEYGEVLVKE